MLNSWIEYKDDLVIDSVDFDKNKMTFVKQNYSLNRKKSTSQGMG